MKLEDDELRALRVRLVSLYDAAISELVLDDAAFIEQIAAAKSADVCETLLHERFAKVIEQVRREAEKFAAALDPALIEQMIAGIRDKLG